MSRSVSISLWLAFVLAMVATEGLSQTTSDSFRCQGNNLVSLGASMYEVVHLCGEPDSVNVLGDPTSDAVWVYDMGRTEYIYYLEFNRGKLTRISHRGERGFK